MNEEAQMEERIREAFLTAEWLGAVPVEEAIESMLAYRHNLSAQERAWFDAEVKCGRHPGLVVETIEIASGRVVSRKEERKRSLATTP
jgi:hypothetical protein